MEDVRFTTEDGVSLQGELRMPAEPPRATAVIAHADPRQGGSKDHPVLWAVRNELAARGFAVLSFNFRGVMGSGGTHGRGRPEVRDLSAALTRIAEEAPGAPTVVFGWSFGANVALREAVEDPRVSALALAGLPVGESAVDLPDVPPASELRALRRPVLFVSGQGDTISPRPELETLARKIPGAQVEVISGTDHFFWRREKELAAKVGAFGEALVAGASRS